MACAEVTGRDIEGDRILARLNKVSDGIRTRDRRDHNAELYQLSYAHHVDTARPHRTTF
jgi:hypothetical protein